MRAISPTGTRKLDYQLAMQRARGRCEAFPGFTGKRCPRGANEVIDLGDGRHVAFCASCRRAGCGDLAGEKAQRTLAFRARQVPLFEAATPPPRRAGARRDVTR
jgi:hypothetical protein